MLSENINLILLLQFHAFGLRKQEYSHHSRQKTYSCNRQGGADAIAARKITDYRGSQGACQSAEIVGPFRSFRCYRKV